MDESIGKIHQDERGRYIYNVWRAKLYIEAPELHACLPVYDVPAYYKVLSVEYISKEAPTPIVTLLTPDKPEAYRLPPELYDWFHNVFRANNRGAIVFPSLLEISQTETGEVSARIFGI
ncbi:MAG: hypothetical protein ACK5NA_08680 [Enterococcus sp.]